MNNEIVGPLPELPPGPMPSGLARAIHGLPITPSDLSPTSEGEPLIGPPTNPWAPPVAGDGRFPFVTEEMEEAELQAPVDAIRKLFKPKQTAATAPTWNLAPPIQQDPDEEKYFTALKPIQKLFHPDVTTITSASAPNLHKSDEWEAPLESEIDALLDGGELALEKRLKDSSNRAALAAWIKKCVDAGDTVEALAEFAAQNDPEKAALILEIGAEL